MIAWGTSIKIVSIRINLYEALDGMNRPVPISSMNQVDVVASFQTTYFISGVAPFGDALVVLAYILGEDGEQDFSGTAPFQQVSHVHDEEFI